MKRFVPIVALAAAGCTALGPDYRRPALELPAGFAAESKPGEPAIAADWWTLYRDPRLDALVTATLAGNADLRLAAARVEEAEAALREAGASFYPDVTGGYAYARNRVSSRSTPPAALPLTRGQNQLLATTAFEIDFWGGLARANEAARAALLGSRYARDVVALTLTSAVAQTYFALRSLDAQIEVLARTIRTRRDSLELARTRLQNGLASELDVFQAQSALSDARVQHRDAERQRALAERALAQLAGRPDLRLAPGDLFRLPVPPAPPAGLPSALLDRRPDVRGAEQALVAENAQIGVAKAALFPSIGLTGALGAQSAAFSNLLSSGAGIWTLGYALSLPIFDAGRREARVARVEARRKQALAGYQEAVQTAFREVSEALVNVARTGATEADLKARLEAARGALELSNLRYASGYSPYLEVLDAQRTANDAELAFVRNRQARLSFSVDLFKSLGGGWRGGGKSAAAAAN
jgi:multidrug efflux system outer membrane protein